MKILFITADKCDDSELFYPYYRLLEEDYEIDIASLEKNKICAKYHFEIDADLSVSDVCCSDYDALLLPGGMAPENLRQNIDVLNIVKEFNDAGKPIAAICHGQQTLISAGVLKGRKATCYPGIKDDLINCGAEYCDEVVVIDGNIVTSRIPDDLPYFMRSFIKMLK